MTSLATDLGGSFLAAAVLLPVAGTLATLGSGSPTQRVRRASVAGWASAVAAAGAIATVAWRGPFGLGHLGPPGVPLLYADPLTVVLLGLGCGVGAVVQSFSLRYLQADTRAPRVAAATGLVVAATAVVATAGSVAVLVGAWVAAGAAFVAAVGYRPDLPGAWQAATRTALHFAVGDSALVAALALVWTRAGDVGLVGTDATRAAAAHLGDLATVVALLVVVAALCRSAQGPFRHWLPETVSAPTPVSALLHAGVVNGGGVLLVRLGALGGASTTAMATAFVVAVATTGLATAVTSRKADVKGALVFSTMSQMGFMVAECTVGAYLAAVVHLVGHGLYKATLFLGSGSLVRRPGTRPPAPATGSSPFGRTLAALGAAAVGAGTVAAFPGVLATRGGPVLLVFVVATLASAGWGWWRHRPASWGAGALSAAAMVVAAGIYGLVLATLGWWLAPSIPAAGGGNLDPWWLLAGGGAGLLTAGLSRAPATRWWWAALALDAGWSPTARVRRGSPAARVRRWSPAERIRRLSPAARIRRGSLTGRAAG